MYYWVVFVYVWEEGYWFLWVFDVGVLFVWFGVIGWWIDVLCLGLVGFWIYFFKLIYVGFFVSGFIKRGFCWSEYRYVVGVDVVFFFNNIEIVWYVWDYGFDGYFFGLLLLFYGVLRICFEGEWSEGIKFEIRGSSLVKRLEDVVDYVGGGEFGW